MPVNRAVMTDANVPPEFVKVLRDFVTDLKATFPEYVPLIEQRWKSPEYFLFIDDEEERKVAYDKAEAKSSKALFEHCKKKLPPRFFDILYENDEMFQEASDADTEFFPRIHFKNLWQCDISNSTRETIWKYLQLLLFSVVGSLEDKDAFGDSAKLFEAINGDEFKTKLHETFESMKDLFDASANSEIDMEAMPNPEQLNEHIAGMLDGKIGQLAREIAEETASDLNMDMEDETDMKGVFTKLMKNPSKLMGLVQKVGTKLDAKLKSGELKESEMLEEATEIMNRMKSMPGMGNIQTMLSKMGMGGLAGGAGGGKLNTGAMEAQLNQRLKVAKTKERIRAKAEASALLRQAQQLQAQQQREAQSTLVQEAQQKQKEEELFKLFERTGKAEKSARPNQKKKK